MERPQPAFDLNDVFSHHSPSDDDIRRYEAIRAAGQDFAAVVLAQAPACADRTYAVRKIREAVMWANAAIALKGAV